MSGTASVGPYENFSLNGDRAAPLYFRDAVQLYRDSFGYYFQLRTEKGLDDGAYPTTLFY